MSLCYKLYGRKQIGGHCTINYRILQPRESPSIVENSIGGVLVTDGIIATDPDTTADLQFTINWTLSYATKSGQAANQSLYEKLVLYSTPQYEWIIFRFCDFQLFHN